MANKHNSYDLLQMQALPLSAKIRMSNFRIKDWYNYYDGMVYVSSSGGKDSEVLNDLVKKLFPDVPTIFVNTGLEHNSVRQKGMELADEVLSPSKNFIQILTEYGYPVISKEIAGKLGDYQSAKRNGRESYVTKQFEGTYVSKNGKSNMIDISKYKYLTEAPFHISAKCCDISKKLPVKQYEKETGRHPYIGTMADESMLRYKNWIKYGCNAFDKDRPTSHPLSFWTEQDILLYIKENDLKIADVYGDIMYTDDAGFFYESPIITEGLQLSTTGLKRTGCTFCLFGASYDDRFLQLKKSDPAKYDFIMRGGKFDKDGLWVPDNGLGYHFIIDWLNEHGNANIKY